MFCYFTTDVKNEMFSYLYFVNYTENKKFFHMQELIFLASLFYFKFDVHTLFLIYDILYMILYL